MTIAKLQNRIASGELVVDRGIESLLSSIKNLKIKIQDASDKGDFESYFQFTELLEQYETRLEEILEEIIA